MLLHSQKLGHGPGLVLLHGMGGTGALWRPLAVDLERDFTVYALDQRGHGASRPANDGRGFSPLDFGQDVIDTLDAQGAEPVWLIGHSMGVRTAAAAAFLRPELVSGLILIDLGLSGAAGGGLGDRLEQFLRILPESFPSRAEARQYLERESPDRAIGLYLLAVASLGLKPGSTDPVRFPFDREALLETIHQARASRIGDYVEAFSKTGRPIHLLRGATSSVWSAQDYDAERVRFSGNPNVVFTTFPGTGHGLPFEKRPEFLAYVRDALGVARSG